MSSTVEPTKEILDITPDTRYIDAVSNSQLGCRRAFAELIDNSLDAGASFNLLPLDRLRAADGVHRVALAWGAA